MVSEPFSVVELLLDVVVEVVCVFLQVGVLMALGESVVVEELGVVFVVLEMEFCCDFDSTHAD